MINVTVNWSTIVIVKNPDRFWYEILWNEKRKEMCERGLNIYRNVLIENNESQNPSQIRFKGKQSYRVKQNKRNRKQYFYSLFGILNSRFKRHTQTAVGGFRSNLSKRVNNWTNRESLSRDKNLQISEWKLNCLLGPVKIIKRKYFKITEIWHWLCTGTVLDMARLDIWDNRCDITYYGN